jgi:hypothetical protein
MSSFDVRDPEPLPRDRPLDYTVFFQPLAFPIASTNPYAAAVVDTLTSSPFTFDSMCDLLQTFIPDSLLPLSPESVVLSTGRCRLLLNGDLLIDGQKCADAPRLTRRGFEAGGRQFDTTPEVARQFVDAANGPPVFGLFATNFEHALVDPSLLLPLVLLSMPQFPLRCAQILFRAFVGRGLHSFLVRSLVLAELSSVPQRLFFGQPTAFARSLVALVCAFAGAWLEQVAPALERRGVELPEFVGMLLKAVTKLPPEALSVIRILLVMLVSVLRDRATEFAAFLAFIEQVLGGRSTVQAVIAQVLLQIRAGQGRSNTTLLKFRPFLATIFKTVPLIGDGEVDIPEVREWVSAHESEVGREVARMVPASRKDHILMYSFAQNFRFLVAAAGGRLPLNRFE